MESYWLAHREDSAPLSKAENEQSRLLSVKQTAAQEKRVLLDRIEELAQSLQHLSKEYSVQREELDKYHRILGPLEDFAARQVSNREEVIALRESLRHWQAKEAEARACVRSLERLISAIRRGEKSLSRGSLAERTAEVQERLTATLLQKISLEKQKEDLEKLRDVRLLSGKREANDDWEIRGRIADVDRQLDQVRGVHDSLEQMRESLKLAASSNSEEWKDLESVNQNCPGCGEAQWASPFCSKTGSRHMGYDQLRGQHASTVAPTKSHPPAWSPPSTDELNAMVESALQSGQWTKQVHVGTFEVSFKEAKTGRVVSDLAEALLENLKSQYDQAFAIWQSANPQNTTTAGEHLPEKTSSRPNAEQQDSLTASNTLATLTSQIKRLMQQLTLMTSENHKLRVLLSKACKSGKLGWPGPTGGQDPSMAASKQKGPEPLPEANVTILRSDDIATEDIRRENAALNQQCTSLILQLVERDDLITKLKETIMNPSTGSSVDELRQLRAQNIFLERQCASLIKEISH